MRNIAEKEIAMGVDVPYRRKVDYITFSEGNRVWEKYVRE